MSEKVKLVQPGALRAGRYEAGKVYEIDDPAEVERLVSVKGFVRVNDEGEELPDDGKKSAQRRPWLVRETTK